VLADILLVAMKEYREVLLRMGSLKGNLLNFVLVVGVFGVFMPLQAGTWWLTKPWMPLAYAWLPFFLVSALVADSFAGERERHTLETLLTTALSDGAILFGKLAAAVAYGYGMLLLVMLVGLVTVNVHTGSLAHPVMYAPGVFAGVVVFGFLATLLIAAVGVLVSLKAKTVRQAGQTLSLGILGMLVLPIIFVAYGFRLLPPQAQLALLNAIQGLDPRAVVVAVALLLAVLDGAIVLAATRRFRRARLVFD
jgi:ABC-2 type transport system permease protein